MKNIKYQYILEEYKYIIKYKYLLNNKMIRNNNLYINEQLLQIRPESDEYNKQYKKRINEHENQECDKEET